MKTLNYTVGTTIENVASGKILVISSITDKGRISLKDTEPEFWTGGNHKKKMSSYTQKIEDFERNVLEGRLIIKQ